MTETTDDIPVITIDGPTASGKGTVATLVARALGFHVLDSGALYRLTALRCEQIGVNIDDADAAARVAAALDLRFAANRVYLGGTDVTEAIRTEAVGQAASRVSAQPQVRAALLSLQHGFRRAPGLVADGRDMGTVIFPDAPLKVFLSASVEARAGRRHRQIPGSSLDSIITELRIRDQRDSGREIAPLRPADGAFHLDTSEMTAELAAEAVLGWWRQHLAAVRSPKAAERPRA